MRMLVRGLSVAALSLLALACSAKDATPPKFEEGKQYKQVALPTTPTDAKRIEVAEFFWYGCSHCNAFDPTLEAWAKTRAGDVDFLRYPNSLGRPEGILHARAYYTAESLNVLPKIHGAMFAAIHKQHQMLNSPDQIGALFNRETGVLPDVFNSTFNGFAVDSRARKGEGLARQYGLTSVPNLVVGGKYVTGPAMAGGHEPAIAVVNFLVDKVRKERGKN